MRRLRWRLLRNAFRTISGGSRLRISIIALCSVLFWVGLFMLFSEAFGFLSQRFAIEQIGYLFSAFFLSLWVMLIFSSGVIAYSGLYQSAEAAFLLSLPIGVDRIFAYKYQEALLFSSWGLLLLCSPLLVAFSIAVLAPWYFYLLFVVFLLAFVYMPTSLGALACLLVARWVPRQRKSLLWAAGVAVILLAGAWGMQTLRITTGGVLSNTWVNNLLGQLELFRGPLLPSWWMTTGLMRAAQGEWSQAVFYLSLLLSNGMFFYLVAAAAAGRLYRSSYSRIHSRSRRRHRYYNSWLGRVFPILFRWVPTPMRLLILKDLRSFRRDPVQWTQFLIYFGLLGSYFFMYPHFGSRIPGFPRYAISFLNLSVAALILSTFTTRFIFPLLSLEGKRFWILGLLPIRRESILWGKFAFAAGGTLLPTLALVVISDVRLDVEPALLGVHALIVAFLCVGLSAISVGLGAYLPNFREDNPSKIAAGFGGTLNLVISTLFIFAMLALMALPAHLYFASLEAERQFAATTGELRIWLVLSMAASGALAAVATVIPLRMGVRAFRRMEF